MAVFNIQTGFPRLCTSFLSSGRQASSRYLRACSPYIAVREYLKARKNDPNYLHTAKMDYLAPKEESQVPVNEADVVRASGQQLINSVNIDLHDIHHLDIKVLCSMDDMFSKIQEIELKMVM